jgi:DNA primase
MGMSSGSDTRARVLQVTDIVELIGRTVRLKRSGKGFVGLCPFHQEKTPSFHVDPGKQLFRCFGCKKSGTAIDFVMNRDRVEFLDALRLLAEQAGIDLPSAGNSKSNASERQVLLDAHSAACSLFEKLLSHPQHGQAARDYLAQRGFTADWIKRFQLGLAVDSWDALLKSATMKKFPPPQLALAGLVKPRESGDGYYDTFRNRLIFPIRDENGRVIAFGGRIMPGSQDPAKYLNSPETPLFSKSRSVFGLDLAKKAIADTGNRTVAIVEGYTDVVMAHQFGVGNVVSIMGTALTEQHVTLLRRWADRIVLVFDPDTAGETAVNRAVEVLLSHPVEIAIASLPDGQDPDEFLLKSGADAFNEILAKAPDALAYKWKSVLRQFKSADDITGRQQATAEYLEVLAKARSSLSTSVDPLRWGFILNTVRSLTGASPEDLNRKFRIGRSNKRGRNKPAAQVSQEGKPTNNSPAPPLTARQRAEGFILGLLLQEPARWDHVQQHIGPADFQDTGLRPIADLFWRHQQDEGQPVLNEFLSLMDEAQKGTAISWVQWVQEASEAPNTDVQSALDSCLQHLLEDREREGDKKLMAHLRRPTDSAESTPVDVKDDLDALRQLQERSRKPDLKRVAL